MAGDAKKKLTFELAPEIHRAFKRSCLDSELTVRQRLTFLIVRDLEASGSCTPDELKVLRELADLPLSLSDS